MQFYGAQFMMCTTSSFRFKMWHKADPGEKNFGSKTGQLYAVS